MEEWTNIKEIKELLTTLTRKHTVMFGRRELLSTQTRKRRSSDVRSSGILGSAIW
jgi:hypothetical protein